MVKLCDVIAFCAAVRRSRDLVGANCALLQVKGLLLEQILNQNEYSLILDVNILYLILFILLLDGPNVDVAFAMCLFSRINYYIIKFIFLLN